MKERIKYGEKFPDSMSGLSRIERYIAHSKLDKSLYHLIKFRASQINGCAYCLDMHSKDARAMGETEQRLYSVSAWRETDYYTEKEQAALEWTEALTLIADTEISDELYERVSKHFDEEELMALTMGIVAINGWNRLAISMKTPAGTYEPGAY